MKICAVILNFRGVEKTTRCLVSLVGQGVDTVYLVDNSDNEFASEAMAKQIRILESGNIDYKISFHIMNENIGFARGVNYALNFDKRSSSPHDLVLILNNDAIAVMDMVSQLKKVILTDENTAIVGPVIINKERRESGIWYQRCSGMLLTESWPFSFYYLCGCCLMFRQYDFVFDEDFFMYGEDAILGWQCYKNGKNLLCVDDAFVRHEGGGSSSQSSLFYEYHMVRAHILIAIKACNYKVEIPFMVMSKSIFLLFRAFVRSARHISLTPLLAFFLGWMKIDLRPR